MSFYRLKYLLPKNSTNAILVNGLRCTQTLSNQLPASTVVPLHSRHHHTLRSKLVSNAQNIHNNQVNIMMTCVWVFVCVCVCLCEWYDLFINVTIQMWLLAIKNKNIDCALINHLPIITINSSNSSSSSNNACMHQQVDQNWIKWPQKLYKNPIGTVL